MTQTVRIDRLFISASLFIQSMLVVFFALRLWAFPLAMKLGWIVYMLALPAVAISIILMRAGKAWYYWTAGFLYASWSGFGAVVDIIWPVEWREPIYWPVFIPYVFLYLCGVMLYWWPLAKIHRLSWFIYSALFILSTLLNLATH